MPGHCALMGATRLEAAEKTDAGRVAPISACVFYQIDRLKSGFEAMGRTVMPGNCALMGATRLASGIFQQPRLASVIVQQLFSGGCLSFLFSRRETRRPH